MTRAAADRAVASAARPGRPITILHIIPTLGVGGTERQLVKLLPRLDRSRFRQSVCFYTPSETLEKPLHAAGIPTIFFNKFSMTPWAFFRRLRRVIREANPDLVHTWLYSANAWGRIAAVSCGVTTLVASDRGMAEPASLLVRLLERFLAGRTVRTSNSRASAASLATSYGLPEETIRVIPNAVDEVPEVPGESRGDVRRSLGLAEDGPVVLMVARQSREKNHAMFFRVAARVGAARRDVTFVALGHQFEPAALRDLLARSGAESFVRLVEQKQDVPRWLRAADVFCFTSNHEGLPNAVLEAMASGLPVVCTDFASAREVVTHGQSGVVVPRDDDAAMADAILELLGDEPCRRRMGTEGRRLARERFGWERLVREMETLYENAVTRGHRQP